MNAPARPCQALADNCRTVDTITVSRRGRKGNEREAAAAHGWAWYTADDIRRKAALRKHVEIVGNGGSAEKRSEASRTCSAHARGRLRCVVNNADAR